MFSVLGEAVMDVATGPGGARRAWPGGSPVNVAVALGRLGRDVELVTELGRDEAGRAIARHVAGSGVALRAEYSARPTNRATVRLDASGAARYEFEVRWELAGGALDPRTRCVHTGSIAAVLGPGADRVRELAAGRAAGALLSYDPNCRPALMGTAARARAAVEAWVRAADLVKASDEDLAWLYPGRPARDVARQWQAAGAAVVVVTAGAAGSMGVCAAGEVAVPARPVEVVDTVGAGDSFTAGLLDALDRRGALGPAELGAVGPDVLGGALADASAAAAITCGRPGADPPTAAELADALGLAPGLGAPPLGAKRAGLGAPPLGAKRAGD